MIDTHPDRHTYLTGTGERGSLFKKPLNFSLRNVLVVSIVLASVFSFFLIETAEDRQEKGLRGDDMQRRA